MEDFLHFLTLQDPNLRNVVLCTILIGTSAAVVGCFLFLKKRALVGDALAHSVLPGICIAFILFNTKASWVLLLGAILSGWVSLLLMNWIIDKSKIKSDTAIGLVLSWFFGIGILLLTSIQKSGNAAQTGLDKFLFGKASAMMKSDVTLFTVVSIFLIVMTIVFFKPLKLITFDKDFAISKGIKVGWFEFVLSTITVVSVATGIQAVGVVLMAALLITPAAAARFWTDDLRKMVFIAGVIGAFSGYVGTFVSYNIPKMPTGPWIVLVVSIIAIFSFLFGSKKGLVFRILKQRKISRTIVSENILKLLYEIDEADGSFFSSYTKDEIMNERFFVPQELSIGLKILEKNNLVAENNYKYQLTEAGVHEGKRITRLHRLWEVYLNQYLKIAPDHVHDDAEAIEHIITPEIEAELVALLEKKEILTPIDKR